MCAGNNALKSGFLRGIKPVEDIRKTALKRTAIFAHFSKNNKIADYVIIYLKNLKTVAENIIFVSDCKLPACELEKIAPYTAAQITEPHGEYDFGSYKRGFQYALNSNLLTDTDELIFANDSCYAPLYDFSNMFNQMSPLSLDFWGATRSTGQYFFDKGLIDNVKEHIQSYFIVFKPQVFNSEGFKNFINGVKKEESKDDIILKYEIGLSAALQEMGFKFNDYRTVSSALNTGKRTYLKDRSPFLKRREVSEQPLHALRIIALEKFLKRSKYPFWIILKQFL